MQVLEIKNNLVKIAYDVNDNLALSSFVIIEDTNTPYVAQVVNVKADKLTNFAIVKLLFTFNEEGILKNYNGTIPSLKSTVSILPSKELLDIIPIENNLIMGELAQQNVTLNVDKTILDNNLLVCSDNVENTNILLKNITKQIDEKIVIFDTDGLFDAENKITFGKDFKLPLNYDTINFIYENELDDVDATSRAVIQDIFIEVQEYTKNLPEGYLPFETFINVVDQQYKETQIPQLVLLKNKLIKYRDLNAFAETLKDVLSLSIAIDKSKVTIIDISEMAPVLQKEIMSYTYGVMKGINETIYSFVKVDNANSSKRLLKTFLSRDGIYTTIICRHEYKYLPELKSAAQNLILFTPQTLQHDFAAYNTFLNKLNTDEFIIYGAHTQNIPLIVELDELELDTQNDDDETESEKDIEEIPSSNVVPMPAPVQNTAPQENVTVTPEPEIQEEETFKAPEVEYPDLGFDNETPSSNEAPTVDFPETETLNVTEEQPEENFTQIELPETFEEPEIEEVQQEEPEEDIQKNFDNEISQEPIEEEVFMPETDIPQVEINEDLSEQAIIEDSNISETPAEYTSQATEEQAPIYNILDDNEIDYQDAEPEVLPLEPEIDYSVEDIDIEENYQEPQPYDENEAMIEQAAKDVDKLIYKKLPNEDVTLDDLSDLQSDELTEDDLNLIGDLASDNGITPEPELEYNEEQPPVVPIYNAEDIEPQEQQSLEPGDRVSSPKYGEGVVEKMIKYGNKMLCSIEFPNIGRRLLDPAMTEIKKLD
ncbi:unknown [Clostridium sp. CAG:715]|mgnify:FL=1|nr:unknown [Clostridium sp. CAG:715]